MQIGSTPLSDHSFVYFIQAGISGPIKIGVTGNPLQRLGQLQTGNAENLRILAIHPGTVGLERALHRYFAPYQLKNEWFDPCEELLDLIESPHTLAYWEAEGVPYPRITGDK